MSAAAEVHMCISGEGDEEDGEEDKYEYDYGGMELMMDDEKAKVCVGLCAGVCRYAGVCV